MITSTLGGDDDVSMLATVAAIVEYIDWRENRGRKRRHVDFYSIKVSQGGGEEHLVLEGIWISSCSLYEIPALIHEHTEWTMANDDHHSRVTACFPRIVIPGSFLDAGDCDRTRSFWRP